MANISALEKLAQASPATDFVLGRLSTRALGYVNPLAAILANNVGYVTGLVSDEDNEQKSVWPAVIPGVGSYRLANRIKTQVKRELRDIEKDKKNEGARPVAHAIAEHIGPATSVLASMGVGAGAGALVENALNKGRDIGGGARTGAYLGAGVAGAATIAAMIASAIKRRRSKQEQIESDKGSVLMKYLVPGTGTYDYFKRLGRSQGERDETEQEKKKKEKK